ncbi:MAG: anthranilate synthase component I [Verrucomicrobiae bacterium]|nr:anthranilate synthase component I [Verrucomicrobiae bacterium]
MIRPSSEEFKSLAGQGNLVPVCRELMADEETPLSVYRKLTAGSPAHSFLLESVEGGEHLGRFSFVGFEPRRIFRVSEGELRIDENGKTERRAIAGDPLAALEAEMKAFRQVQVPGMPRFTGGAVGFFGYEYLSSLEPVPRAKHHDLRTPDLYFMIMDSVVVFDRVRQSMQIVVHAATGPGIDADRSYQDAVARIERIEERVRAKSIPSLLPLGGDAPPVEFKSGVEKPRFLQMVEKAKEYIHQGDVIQTVISQRFSAATRADPLTLYRALRTVNPSPYMFLMQLEGFSLVGSSPEIHVRCEEGVVEIRPIAGTRPRGRTTAQDLANEKDLLADQKERAEHLMLVDLARNDIGRVCEINSVRVEEFMTIERYSHVMHIVSQVEGHLSKDQTPFGLLRATFPAGTVSGAPKIRAAQIIAELEATQRGPYAGALGYFSFGGNLDSCITIRTVLLKDGHAYVQTGAGIVADSVPENEYQETVNKAKAMFKAVSLAEALSRTVSSP